VEVINNKRQYRFETPIGDGEMATLEYRWLKGSMVLMHTLVPKSGRGTGVGSALVKYVLDYARDHNLKIIVYCPFATLYLSKHPEYNDLLDTAHAPK
jgi:predicted GNAT family acetyltransferase